MFLLIEHDVLNSMFYFPESFQNVKVISLQLHTTPANPLGKSNRERAHTSGEDLIGSGFSDQMDMIGLKRIVPDFKSMLSGILDSALQVFQSFLVPDRKLILEIDMEGRPPGYFLSLLVCTSP